MKETAWSRREPSSLRPLVIQPLVDVALWRPRILVTSTIDAPGGVGPGDPPTRPPAVIAQVGATSSFLRGIDEVRQDLAARAAAAEARARTADSERDRVAAAMETYELHAAFDEVLVGAWREVTALMQERGLR
jgi:hypothetical protein